MINERTTFGICDTFKDRGYLPFLRGDIVGNSLGGERRLTAMHSIRQRPQSLH